MPRAPGRGGPGGGAGGRSRRGRARAPSRRCSTSSPAGWRSPSLRKVEIQDLLRREPIQTDLDQVRVLATGETVLVTGAGGSIGSELCRQLARLEPAQILLLGHGENSIFDVLAELPERFPNVTSVPDHRRRARPRAAAAGIRAATGPYSVFHAAAHKHVPLMEEQHRRGGDQQRARARKNVAELSAEFGVEHLVLISTDKAVRPTSVMGATKRVAEQIVQEIAEAHERKFVAVRFGNVLGSRGSVVPTFLRQIQAGGPVTVTHPEMRRYFMTIPEAVQLVLQAGAIGQGGEVFVLDMGEPVKMLDLATDLIRLSGLEVGTDIEIRFTGMRPGEKLYEELFFDSESAAADRPPEGAPGQERRPAASASAPWWTLLVEGARGRGGPTTRSASCSCRLVPDFKLAGVPPTEVLGALPDEPTALATAARRAPQRLAVALPR